MFSWNRKEPTHGEPVRLAALSVDLDEIGCYAAIHGLDGVQAPPHAVYDQAIPRFVELLEECDIPATFFAIGADLDRAENQTAVAKLHASGHEIANHSWHHLYDLSRQRSDVIRAEIAGAQERIGQSTGTAPVGFRAPGYVINDKVFDCLVELGFEWDSSVFPCPGYYSAKAAAIALKGLVGRRSHSIVDRPMVLRAPTEPYWVGKPYYARSTGGHQIFEMPIGVTPITRLPFIGTTLTLLGERGARWLTRQMVGKPFVNLELHGIDLSDRDQDGLAALAPHQPDLRRSAKEKYRALRAAIEVLKRHNYHFTTLSQAAETMRSG